MPRFERLSPSRVLWAALSLLLLAGALVLPAPAQTILVQNGATAEVNNGGVWDLQGGTMDFGPAGASTLLREERAGRVTGGTLTATRNFGSPSQANPAGLGVVLSAAPDVGEITVTRGHTVQTAPNGNVSIARYYDLSVAQNNSGLDATLRVGYADAELNGLAESELELFKSEDGGSTWTEEGADSRDDQFNTVTLSGIERFSRWTLGSQASPLPVELAQFDGTPTGDEAVTLRWTTASEQNNAGFRIERARADANGQTGAWTEVGSVEGGGTTATPQSYQFQDDDLPYAADRLTYRLKQVDTDGTTSVSDPVTVERRAVERVQLLGTYPNPARAQATVRFALPDAIDAQNVTLRLYDVLGRQVRTVATEATPGRHTLRLNTDRLTNGVYVLRLKVSDTARTQRLTIVK